MQVKIAAGDLAAAAQSAASSSGAAVPVEEQQRPRGGGSEQLREGGDSRPTVRLPVHMTPPPATAGSVSCGSRENSSSSNKRKGSHSTDKRRTSKPAATGVRVPAGSGRYAVRAGASSATACGRDLAAAPTAGAAATGTFTEAATTPANAAAGGVGRESLQQGAAEDAALNRRMCAAVQLLVKTLVSTEDIVVSLAEMPEALRQRPATLSFATVRAKILFSRYFFKKLKIYKTKRTRCFAVPAVIHTETGLIHASGSPIDWPRGLAARVLASQQPAAAAAPAAPSGGRSGGLPVGSKGGDAAPEVAAAGTAAASGWAATVPAPSTAKGVTTPAVSAAAAGTAAAAHGLLGVTSSSSSTTPPTGPQRRRSSTNSSDRRTTTPHSSNKGSSDTTGSRSTPSEERSKTHVTVSDSGTCLLEGSEHAAYQQQGVVHQTPHQHHTAVYGRPTTGGLALAGGRGFSTSESTSAAALGSSACASAAIAAGAEGGRGAAGGGGATAAAAGRPGAATETEAATATLRALVQGGAPSRCAAECSVRDIVSSRFLHWHATGGGFTDQQQRIWEKSSSALVSGGGNNLFEERADFLMSNNSSSSFTLVSFLFTPLPGKGLLSQPKDAAAEASQEAPAAASDIAAVGRRRGRGGAAADAGAAAAARATEEEAENTAAATPKGREEEEEEEERRPSDSPRGLGAAAGQEDTAKKTAAVAAARAGAATAETTRATTAGAEVWDGDNYSLPSTQEEAAARINRLLQDEQLLGIRGFDKAAGGSKRRSRYKVTCSVVCGADSWAIGRIELGSHCMSGQRSYNEDRVCVMPILDTQDGSRKRPNSKAMFCAVYDGHNGEDAVNYVQEHLHRNIAKSKAFQGDMLKAIRAGFMATDTALRAMVCERIRNVGYDDDDVSPFSSGSTACTALLRGTQLYVGNLGDSRCVLSRAARSHLITVDHSCRTNAEEQRRVKQDGGHFDTDGYLSGALGVSRAFGAFDKKGGQKLSGLSGEPEIHRETLRREDEFMIIACDGVFDVVSCQEAVTCVRTHLREGKSADDAAMGLCQLAFQRHSLDNLSAVVAVFQSPEPLQKEKLEKKEKRLPQHSKVPGETESTAAAGEGCRPRRKVIDFSALKGLL